MFATVIDDDKGFEVEVEFETATDFIDNAGTSLELCPESDRLRINGQTPEEVRALGHLYYLAELDSASEVRIELTHGDELHEVLVEVPPHFEIDSPVLDSVHSRGAALELSWSPAWPGEQVELAIEDQIGSDCIEGLGFEELVADSGSFTLAGDTLVSGAQGGSCQVKASLTRVLEASYPEQLAPGGGVTAIVNRRVAFISDP